MTRHEGSCQEVVARAQEALAGTLREPRTSLRSAQRALRAASPCPPAVQAWCLLAIGDAWLKLARIDACDAALRRALDLDDGSLPRPLVLRLRLTLASARVLHGDFDGAWRLVDLAQAELDADIAQGSGLFDALDSGAIRDRRARLLIEAERPQEALPELDAAVQIFEAAQVDRPTLIALNNRGLVHLHLRRYSAARRDLERVEGLALRTDLPLIAAAAAENLGYLAVNLGDYPQAVEAFGRAERGLAASGIERGQLWVDKAKVLLALRELTEAEDAARRAAQILRAQQEWMLYPSANLLIADIALSAGDHESAISAAETAVRAFRRVGRRPSAALARLTLLQARVAAGVDVAAGRARTVAEALERDGHLSAAVDARILAARLAADRGRVTAARADLVRAAALGRDGPAHARAQAWLAEAMLRRSLGRRRQAYLALSAGLQVLAQHRASLGATEVRAQVGLNREALTSLGLQMALEDADAPTVHVWGEHRRATAGLERPGRPPDDDRLADLLDRLRATSARLVSTDLIDVRVETARQARLERDIRQHLRRTQGGEASAGPPIGLRALHTALGGLAMLELIDHDGALFAVTVVDGEARLHGLGPTAAITAALRYTSFALDRLAGRSKVIGGATASGAHDAAVAVIRRSGEQVERHVLRPLEEHLGDRDLVIVAPPLLHAFPWAVAPSCRGRAVSVCPSASLWAMAAGRRPRSGRIVVAAGPGLPGAVAEARGIDAVYAPGDAMSGDEAGRRTLLPPPASTATAVAEAMNGARLAHLAAHGDLRSGNPSFSAVWLADGPFMVHDIERLDRTPHHVVLAACHTARSHVLAGREILGLTMSLLSQDTAAIVAPVVAVPDAQTMPLMLAYHRRVAAGVVPARALAQAQAQVFAESDDPRAVATAASFVCLGAGHTPVFAPARRGQRDLIRLPP